MMSHFSMAAVDSLLAFQAQQGITGDMVEMGVFRGKSAAVLARRMSPSETLHLYDIEDYLDRDKVGRSSTKIEFNIKNTFDLKRRDLKNLKRSTKFCHVDASHMFDPTVHEIDLADYMLADYGILCLDDFTNLNYSQILSSTFKYLFTRQTDLTIFLVTAEKAYLCRRRALPIYEQFILNDMQGQMTARGIPSTCIARTDTTDSYRAFHLREKLKCEPNYRYGQSIDGHLYNAYQPPNFATKTLHFLARNIRRKKYARPVIREPS